MISRFLLISLVGAALSLCPTIGLGSSLPVLSSLQVGNLGDVQSAVASLPLDERPVASAAEIEYLKSVYVLDREFQNKLPQNPDCLSLTRYRAKDPAQNNVVAYKEFSRQDLLETEALMGSRDYDARFALLLKDLGLDPSKFRSIANFEGLLKDFETIQKGKKANPIDREPLPALTKRLATYLSTRLSQNLPSGFEDVLAYNLVVRRLDKDPSQWKKHLSAANEVSSSASKLDLLQLMGRRFAQGKNASPADWTQNQLVAAQALGFQAVQAKPPHAASALRFLDPKNPRYIFEASLPIKMAKGGDGFKGSADLKSVEPNKAEFITGDGQTVRFKAATNPNTGRVGVAALETTASGSNPSTPLPPPMQVTAMGGGFYAEVKDLKGATDLNAPSEKAEGTNRVALNKGQIGTAPSTTNQEIGRTTATKQQALEVPQKAEVEIKSTAAAPANTKITLKAETKQDQVAQTGIRKHEESAKTSGELKIPDSPFILGFNGHFMNTYQSDGSTYVSKIIEGSGQMKRSEKDWLKFSQQFKSPDQATSESRQRLDYSTSAPGGSAVIGGERLTVTKYDSKTGKPVSESTDYKASIGYGTDDGYQGRLILGVGTSKDKASGEKKSRTMASIEGSVKGENYTFTAELGVEQEKSNRADDATRFKGRVRYERDPANFVEGTVTHDTRRRSNTVEIRGHMAETFGEDGPRVEGGMKLVATLVPDQKIQKSAEVYMNIKEHEEDSSYWRIRCNGNPSNGSKCLGAYVIPLGVSK